MTSDQQRSHWDTKYEQGLPSLEKPDPFFLSAFNDFAADRFSYGGSAFDLAGGIGRHSLWLARRNWRVTVVDISEVAIRQLEDKACRLGVSLELFAIDANDYRFETNRFDLIVMFYHFDRDICPRLLSSLKSGGILICKSRVSWNTYEGSAPARIQPLGRKEILSLLPGVEVLHYEERQVGDRGVVEYVGKKNAPNVLLNESAIGQ